MRIAAGLAAACALAAPPALGGSPVIDMHMHASTISDQDRGTAICIPAQESIPVHVAGRVWGRELYEAFRNPPCDNPVRAADSEEALIAETARRLAARDAVGVLQGPPDLVRKWMEAAPGRFIPSLQLQIGRDPYDADQARMFFENGEFRVLGEVSNQYVGIAPNDPRMDEFWAMAEELDIPVGIHMGTGPPGSALLVPSYRVSAGNPLLLEDVLVKHPGLRISVQHMAEGYLDELKIMMWTYPQIYVEISGPNWWAGNAFDADLKDLVDAGFGKRILFGSDGMVWPGIFDRAVDGIEQADYLTDVQKRDILFNNAVRFLKLDAEVIAARAEGQAGVSE